MPQIQYAAYTSPPAFTPPTTDALGWRAYEPDDVRLTSRGRWQPGRQIAALQTTGANVFAVENWAIPGQSIGKAYLPENPQQFQRRQTYRARGGSYLNAPSFFYDPDVENFPAVLGWGTETPDSPYQFLTRTRRPTYPFLFPDPTTPAGVQTGTDWMTAWPAQVPRLTKRPFYTPDVDVMTPEAFPPVLGWGVELPDVPFQTFLKTRRPSYPHTFPDPTTPVTVTTTWDWMRPWPDQVPRLQKRPMYTADVDVLSPEAFPPTLEWSAIYPDLTRRRSLGVGAMPVSVQNVSPLPGAPTYFASFGPETTKRASLAASRMPSAFRGEAIAQFAPTLQWGSYGQPTTSRRALSVANLPAIAQTVGRADPPITLGFGAFYPSTTARAVLGTAKFPVFWLPPFPIPVVGTVIDRRHDDQPDRVGTRAQSSRIQGL